jgi:16S rRNA C967 or C1407 C5-methylase (RsmB/RsmF family)
MFKPVVYLEKCYYKLVTLAARNNIIKLLSYMNYFTSIQLRLNSIKNTFDKVSDNFEDLEFLTKKMESEIKLEQPSQLNTKDDSFAITRRVSF